MANDLKQQPIIIKRTKKISKDYHSSAWKIAYADFVTAMMAFFLLMWLLNSSNKTQLEGISDYFKTPIKISILGGSESGDRSSVIKGGGTDFNYQDGQVQKGIIKEESIDKKTIRIIRERAEQLKLEELKKRLEQAIEANPSLKKFENQLLLDITTEGLRIQIVDEQNRPMFALSKADLQPYTKTILREIGKMLNEVNNKISLSGHTDSKPYQSGNRGYSNWELSADRANASRRELIMGGMDPNKVLKVVGLSSAVLFDKNDSLNPINRRISIIVMNEKTEISIIMNEPTVDIDMQDAPSKGSLQKP